VPRFEGSEHVLVSRPEPGVAVLELARGKVNAIDHAPGRRGHLPGPGRAGGGRRTRRTAATAVRLARSIAANDRDALTLAKQSLDGCEPLDLERGYRLEQTFTVRLSEHASSKEAVAGRMAELGMHPSP
jgi:hypothetical protein